MWSNTSPKHLWPAEELHPRRLLPNFRDIVHLINNKIISNYLPTHIPPSFIDCNGNYSQLISHSILPVYFFCFSPLLIKHLLLSPPPAPQHYLILLDGPSCLIRFPQRRRFIRSTEESRNLRREWRRNRWTSSSWKIRRTQTSTSTGIRRRLLQSSFSRSLRMASDAPFCQSPASSTLSLIQIFSRTLMSSK